MKKLNKISYLILLVSICFSCGNDTKNKIAKDEKEAKEPQLPNIVFILSDDQAWTDYGFMGHKQIETPRLDKFASESLTFTRGYVPTSLCSPSLATIITGVYPKNHGVLGNDRVLPGNTRDNKKEWRAKNYEPVIENFKSLNTLPDLLKDKGYLSFQTGKWWIGNHKIGGFDYGMTHGNPSRGGRHGDYGLEIGRKGMDTLNSYIDVAVKQKKPFFLWYAPFLPHAPHNPPQRLLDKYLPKAPTEHVAKYWAMCEWFDETCGELFDAIEERGLTDNTVFVYVCDNGWVQNLNDSSYDKISKRSPYDLGMRTPIMYKWAGQIKPKMDITTVVSSIDMVPTVLDILDINKPKNLPGISVLNETELNNREVIFGEIYAHDFNTIESSMFYNIAIAPPYKLIVPDAVRKAEENIQLFNIDIDPFEKNNIAKDNPEIVEKLKQQIASFRAE
ncbi:sulfatase-like hydrolase/transferase [Sabulilitoribacter multivorans]|uniref:Sulfatase-like hydrolase/transferase n=1 Tax=Flaviramulus multivorans TaxID=1304750 RepID=A0ABS9ILN8_9FLAO|nr:sulfatase-like hydrolase/transferase [Flaviramulus multivorans]MCF7561524.1 sulfatase-like hydrolase/transferase [Flaviramulus multivorans]